MDTKRLRVEVKDADKGVVDLVFATYNVVDAHRDVTVPGAFEPGAKMPVSAYGHASWDGKLPVGVATIGAGTAKEARATAQFFLDIPEAAATFATVKRLHAEGLGEWSYGYDPVEYAFGEHEGHKVRFLNRLKVHEVSPVLVGAGVGTRTLTAKSGAPADAPVATGYKRTIAPHETPTVARAWNAAQVIGGLKDAAPADLRSVFAWVDPAGDPEATASYKLAHHHGVGGAANIRACLAGIAALNGTRDAGVPECDRKAAYDHLAAHLRDADREPPELRTAPGGALKFLEEGASALAVVASFIDRASEVMALRAAKGKGLAPASADLLAWPEDDLGRLKSVLANPHLTANEPLGDDEIRTLLAGLARVNNL